MDIKSTVVGAIFGAGLCGTAWWLAERNRQPAPLPAVSSGTLTPNRSSERFPTAVRQRDSARETPAPAPITQSSEVSTDSPDTDISTSNEARAKRWKEERDLNWSYGTEQALRQYLAENKSTFKFDVVLVECRTSFCEIQASGYADDAWPSWLLMTHDVTKQPWSEFESAGNSGGQRDGRPIFVATLFRRLPPVGEAAR